MPAGDSWTINAETGGEKGKELNGCIITQTATQTQLFAPAPNSSTELGSVNSTTPPITFDSFSLPTDSETKFNLTIDSFSYPPPFGEEAQGKWSIADSLGGDPDNGEWTAVSTVAPAAEDEKLAADKKAAAADPSRGI